MSVKIWKPDSQTTSTSTSTSTSQRLDGVVIGMLSGLDTTGAPLVIFPGNPTEEPVVAKSLAVFTAQDTNREVALLFENGDPQSPLLVGLIQHPAIPQNLAEPEQSEQPHDIEGLGSASLELDGEIINLKAKDQITLKCGKASITLTKAGKILLRGTYLLNRSSGVNRIKGGSVQIN